LVVLALLVGLAVALLVLVLVLALVLVLVLLRLLLLLVLLLLFASFLLVAFFPSVLLVRTFVPCSGGLFLSGLALCIPVAFVPCWLVFLVVSLLVLSFPSVVCPSVGVVAFLLSVAPVLVLFFSSSLALSLALSVSFLPLPLSWRAYDVPPPLSFHL